MLGVEFDKQEKDVEKSARGNMGPSLFTPVRSSTHHGVMGAVFVAGKT